MVSAGGRGPWVPVPAAVRHKLDVLRSHCETVGRDYDEIEKTTMIRIDASTSESQLLDLLHAGHDLVIGFEDRLGRTVHAIWIA